MTQQNFYNHLYSKTQFNQTSHIGVLTNRGNNREDVAFILLKGGDRFLDIGCGDGNLVIRAKKKYKEVYGVDIAETRIARAQVKSKNSLESGFFFQACDISNGLPFKDDFFNAISIIVTLEFVFNPIELIKEIHRTLVPGGQVVIISSNIAYFPRRINALLGKPPHTSAIKDLMAGGTLHYFTFNTLEGLLNDKGFHVTTRTMVGSFSFLRRWWKSLLSSSIVISAIKH